MRSASTLADVRPASAGAAPRWGRRIGTVVLLLVVIAGAAGLFGVRSDTATVTQNGYTLTVVYPKVARAGLDAPWRVHVHHPGGFSDDITISVTLDYFRMWESQGFFPDPDSASNDGKYYDMQFSKPDGDDFQVDYDAYIQPTAQFGKGGHVRVFVGKNLVAQLAIHTWLAP